MGFFSRKKTPGSSSAIRPVSAQAPISEFWTWWHREGAVNVDGAIRSGTTSDSVREISRRVDAIDPDLAWELGPGEAARHRFTLSPGGVSALRPLTERWMRAAPKSDELWEFAPSRERTAEFPTGAFQWEDFAIDLDLITFGASVDSDRRRVDVSCYNPVFRGMPEKSGLQVTFLILDWLVGEDDVGKWIGEIEARTTPPLVPQGPKELRSAVDALAAQHAPDEFRILSAKLGGLPFVAVVRNARWIDYPTFDLHVRIVVPYAEQNAGRLPIGAGYQSLVDFEDELETLLGPRGVMVARSSTNGRASFDFYLDSEDQNGPDALTKWVAAHAKVTIEQVYDPSWKAVRHLTN